MSARCAPGEGQCGDRQGAAARRGWGHGWHMRCWGWTLQTREQRLSLALLLLTPHLPLLQLMRFCPGAPRVPVAPEAPRCAQSSPCSACPGLAPAHSPQLSPRHSGVQLAASASLWGQEPQPGAPGRQGSPPGCSELRAQTDPSGLVKGLLPAAAPAAGGTASISSPPAPGSPPGLPPVFASAKHKYTLGNRRGKQQLCAGAGRYRAPRAALGPAGRCVACSQRSPQRGPWARKASRPALTALRFPAGCAAVLAAPRPQLRPHGVSG